MGAAYRASGLRQGAFGKQRDLRLKTLARYVTRYRAQQPSGRRIEVKCGFDTGPLQQLVTVPEEA